MNSTQHATNTVRFMIEYGAIQRRGFIDRIDFKRP